MKQILVVGFLLLGGTAFSQELYPYSEPASNMPAHSISLKNTAVFHGDIHTARTLQRYMPEVMFGLSKKWMLHAGVNVSNMHQQSLVWEGARLYGKYRFYSNDEVHRHFRMAVFGAATYSRNHLDHNEINLAMGEQSGVQGGLIATQLWNKFALSATAGWNEVLDDLRSDKIYRDRYAFQAVNYSLSAGYLLLPFEYKDYNQTNVNLYVELLGGRNINFPLEKYYVDLAPSVQAIFNSTAKLNVGYRFQLGSDIYRLTKNSFMISFEYIFLDALKKKAPSAER
ncbi:hypothetical protein [Flavisolibacter nicotianae]|uniref:hypothetical protein n=1 Tax=Flavisolibacter nicotianae TaxID=2364882 RepID=UPI0013C3EB5A|nr:hypothetical protein [Flavisolibacter nicotianae]